MIKLGWKDGTTAVRRILAHQHSSPRDEYRRAWTLWPPHPEERGLYRFSGLSIATGLRSSKWWDCC
jgi:hypothetical protein